MGQRKLASLVVDLEARVTKFERGMNKAQKKADKFGSTMKKLGGSIAGALAGRQILRGLNSVIQAFAVQEEAVISLGAALEVTGNKGSASLQLLTRNAAELQQITTKGDEAIIAATSSMSLLATELSAAELADAQKALIGIADTFLKGDVQNAALLVGKSIGSTTNALTRYGIQVDTTATQQEKLRAIVEQSAGFFEVSKRRTDSVAGATQQLSNAFGDLKEVIGGVLTQSTGFMGYLRDLKQGLEGLTFLLSTDAFDEWLKTNQLLEKTQAQLAAGTTEHSNALIRWVANLTTGSTAIKATSADIEKQEELVAALQIRLAELDARMKGGPSASPSPRTGGGPAVKGIVELEMRIPAALQSVESLLNAAITHSEAMAEGFESGAMKMRKSSDWVLEGFDAMAMAAGVFRNQTARLVVRGIGSMLESFGKSDLLKDIGMGLQNFGSGGVVQGPMGSPQLAVVHAGETVTPRGAATAPIVVNQTLNWNIAAIDGQSVGRWVDQNRFVIAGGVAQAAQDAPGIAKALRG